MKKARMVKRILSLVLIVVLMAPLFTTMSFAADVPPTYGEEPVSVEIHLPANSEMQIGPRYTVAGDTDMWVMTKYFSAGRHSISVNCSTGYNVTVYLTYSGSYVSGCSLTSTNPGPWYPTIKTAGNYAVWVRNESSVAVDLTLNVS